MKVHSRKSMAPLAAWVALTTLFFVSASNAAETVPTPSAPPPATAPPPASPLAASTTHPFAPLNAPYKAKNPLVWDALEKTLAPAPGTASVEFTFWVTNTSAIADIIINQLNVSCDCTTPSTKVPWKLAPGTSGPLKATVDLKGKSGNLSKTIMAVSTAGLQTLTLKINLPAEPVKLPAAAK